MTDYSQGVTLGTNGLLLNIPSDFVPLGTDSNTVTKKVTPAVGNTIVAATTETGNFWDNLGKITNAVTSNALVQEYVKGKIIKEQINDGVPVYTTQGNPNDQAGGRLLSDVATQQKATMMNYYVIGGGIIATLLAIYFVTRK